MLENKRPFVLRTIQYLHRAKTVLIPVFYLYFFGGAPDGGGVRIPYPARNLRCIPYPAEFFCPIRIPQHAHSSLFSYCIFLSLFVISLRNNTSKMPNSPIVGRVSQIYGRLLCTYVTHWLELVWLSPHSNIDISRLSSCCPERLMSGYWLINSKEY